MSLPPVAPKKTTVVTVHGHSRYDDYAWLRAENWTEVLEDASKLSPPIRAYLEAENAYTEDILSDTVALQEILFQEMRGRVKEEDYSVPEPDGPFEYYVHYRKGAQYPLYCRKPRMGGEEVVLLDGELLSQGTSFFDIGACIHSPDHTFVAWSEDRVGSETYTIRVRNLVMGMDLWQDTIKGAGDEIVWTADSEAFYYVRLDEHHRPNRVFYHRLGTPTEEDILVYEEKSPDWFVDIGHTLSNDWVTISVHNHGASEVYIVDSHAHGLKPYCIRPREPGIRYSVESRNKMLILLGNFQGAEDFAIFSVPFESGVPVFSSQEVVVPHKPGVLIEDYMVFADYLVRLEVQDAQPRIIVRSWETEEEYVLDISLEPHDVSLRHGFEFSTHILHFTYSSLRIPEEIYEYAMNTGERTLLKRTEIPSGHNPDAYCTERLSVEAADGAKVPVSLLYSKNTPLNGTAPCLLYGYGAYGHRLEVEFEAPIFSLVDRGFIFALAHVRGGTECGWRWYLEGKLKKKPNSFDDFIAVAQKLAGERYTCNGRIVAQGASAGGLLMGAVANRAPEGLFGAFIAQVPFVDTLNTMCDGDLPLTPPEWVEWGNPILDSGAFDTIAAYSPYDNIQPRPMPPILALGSLADSRVTYWEPAKWVARMRATMTGGGPILLKTHMTAGHGGSSGRFDHLRDLALCYSFAVRYSGVYEEGKIRPSDD